MQQEVHQGRRSAFVLAVGLVLFLAGAPGELLASGLLTDNATPEAHIGQIGARTVGDMVVVTVEGAHPRTFFYRAAYAVPHLEAVGLGALIAEPDEIRVALPGQDLLVRLAMRPAQIENGEGLESMASTSAWSQERRAELMREHGVAKIEESLEGVELLSFGPVPVGFSAQQLFEATGAELTKRLTAKGMLTQPNAELGSGFDSVFHIPPNPNGGGGCQSSCSTTCAVGGSSCSATCSSPRCASCSCDRDLPSCSCS